MAESQLTYVTRNCLQYMYRTLRVCERSREDTISPYKDFFEKMLSRKLSDTDVSKSEIEGFYLGRQTEGDFVEIAENRITGALPDSQFQQHLLSTVWDIQCDTPTYSMYCSGSNHMNGFELWEIFVRLDSESNMEIHIDDVCDIVLRIFKASGHDEDRSNIQEWFCGETNIEFWSFFKTMVTSYSSLMQSTAVSDLCTMVRTETLREGRLMKKGHVVHNWKARWFSLTTTSLSYRESKDSPCLKTIAINGNTLVQNMPECKGHSYRFRVLDGLSSTPTEISATDEVSMREWIAFIKLAIKMSQTEGRNFLHKYHTAMETFPKSFFTEPSTFIAINRQPVIKKSLTTPARMPLKSSASVPLDKQVPNKQGSRDTMPLPPVPGNTESEDDESLENAPPLPPQRFNIQESVDHPIVTLRNQTAKVDSKDSEDRPLRRHSSIELSDIHHIQVDGDLEYAVITKVPKRKKKISEPNPPNRRCGSPIPTKEFKPLDIPPQLPSHRRTPSPILSTKSYSTEEPIITRPVPKSRALPAAPVQKGYIELQFESGNLVTQNDGGQSTESLPPDVKNKFGYSQLRFEDEKKQATVDSGSPVAKGPPPPVPKYRGNMMKNITDTSLVSKPHANGVSDSNTKHLPSSKPSSLPDLKKRENKTRELDYAVVSFSNSNAMSPTAMPSKLPVPQESDEPKYKPPRVDYSTVILSNTGASNEIKESVKSTSKIHSNYENFDLGPTSGNSSENRSEKTVPSSNGPVVSGSARLIKNMNTAFDRERREPVVEESSYVNTTHRPDPAHQPRPKVPPHKGVVSPTQERSPQVPVRKTS